MTPAHWRHYLGCLKSSSRWWGCKSPGCCGSCGRGNTGRVGPWPVIVVGWLSKASTRAFTLVMGKPTCVTTDYIESDCVHLDQA